MKKSSLIGALFALFCLSGMFTACSDPSEDSTPKAVDTSGSDEQNTDAVNFKVEPVTTTPGRYKISFNQVENATQYILTYTNGDGSTGEYNIDAEGVDARGYLKYEYFNNERMANFSKATWVYTFTLKVCKNSRIIEKRELTIEIPYTGAE